MRIQGLIFVQTPLSNAPAPEKVGGSDFCSTGKVYVLLNPKGCSEKGVSGPIKLLKPLTSSDDFNPPPKADFEMIEVWEEFFPHSMSDKREAEIKERLFVDGHNLTCVKSLFPRTCRLDYRTGFRLNSKELEADSEISALVGDNLKSLEKLLSSAPNIHYRHSEGGTIAHFAVERTLTSLLPLLQKCGTNLNALRNDSCTPLQVAVKKGDLKMAKTLLDSGANISAQMTDGNTALHLAIEEKFFDVAKLLIDSGADVNATTISHRTPLHAASELGLLDVIKMLLNKKARIDPQTTGVCKLRQSIGLTPLHVALIKKRFKAAKALVDNGASTEIVCNKGRNALFYAVNSREKDTIDYFLERRLDFDSPGNKNAFYQAFRKEPPNEYVSIIKVMMTYGFSVDQAEADEPDVLFGAIHKNLPDIVTKLLNFGADVHQEHVFMNRKTTPIHIACKYGKEDVVRILLDNGADPFTVRGAGTKNTAIADAIDAGNVAAVKELFRRRISFGNHPEYLHQAISQGNYELVQLLLENGFDVNHEEPPVKKYRHPRPMNFASERGDREIVDILMRYGAYFEFRDIHFNIRRGYSRVYASSEFFKDFLAYGFIDLKGDDEKWVRDVLSDPYNIGDDDDDDEYRGYYFYGFRQSKYREDDDKFDLNASPEEKSNAPCLSRILVRHLIKLQAAGMTVMDNVIPNEYGEVLDFEQLRKECETELEQMKKRTICESGVTLFDVLMRSTNRLARFLRNESVRKTLNDYQFEEEFPRYARIIKSRVRLASWRRETLDKGMKPFSLLVRRRRLPALPDEVKEHILSLLGNQDIIRLISCYQRK